MLFLSHRVCIVEQTLQEEEESPLLLVGSGPTQVFPLQFIEEDLTSQSYVCNAVGTTSFLGEIFCPIPKDGQSSIIKGDQFFHSVNVRWWMMSFLVFLTQVWQSVHFWTHVRQTTFISQLWGPCINQFIWLEWLFDLYQNQATWQLQRALMRGICQTNRTICLTTNNTPRA